MPKPSQEKIALFSSLYQSDEDYDLIAEKTGFNKKGFSRLARKLKLELKQSFLSVEEEKGVLVEYARGVAVFEISSFLKKSPSTIYSILERNNIERNKISNAILNPNAFVKRIIKPVVKSNYRVQPEHLNEKNYIWYIPTINGVHLTRENVQGLSKEERLSLVPATTAYFRERGFPYPDMNQDKLFKEFSDLKKIPIQHDGKNISTYNRTGTDIVRHFSPHFYEMKSNLNKKPSYLEAFHDDKLLAKAVENRFFQDGGYQLNGSTIARGFRAGQIAFVGSTFRVLAAKTIYSIFTKEGDFVYDYSMGYGHRLLGAASLPYKINYIGVDPFAKSFESNKAIHSFYKDKSSCNADMYCLGSEDFCPEEYIGKVDFAFSSPPYFDIEVYEDSEKQAYHNGYNSFINQYWKKTSTNLYSLLKDGGKLALNIKDNVSGFSLSKDMIKCLTDVGFELIDCYNLNLIKNKSLSAKDSEASKLEPIYIFQKV